MASLREIKTRIDSINTTSKLIKAIDMVASTQLNRSRKQLEGVIPINDSLKDLVLDASLRSETKDLEFFTEREVKSSLYVVITSDRGFAGSYNNNILRLATRHMEEKPDPKIIVVGLKGESYFRKQGVKILKSIVEVSASQVYYGSQNIAKHAKRFFLDKIVDEVFIVYSEFENILSYKPTVQRLLPIATQERTKGDEHMIFEPDSESYLQSLVPLYLHMSIFHAFSQTHTSEHAARMVSMDGAGKNAEELLEDLDKKYHKRRQAAITNELNEIIGSRTAMNKDD